MHREIKAKILSAKIILFILFFHSMKLLSFLGSLPAASSEKGLLNGIDLLKLLRMGVMMVTGYVLTVVIEALIRDMSNGALGIDPSLTTPIAGVLTLVLESVRRQFAKPSA